MIWNGKKILFQAGIPEAQELFYAPSPATNNVPDWFKDTKKFANGFNDYQKASIEQDLKDPTVRPIRTFKSCVPLTDTFTAGYTIKSSATIFVKNFEDKNISPQLQWEVSYPVADYQEPNVLGNYPTPHGYSRHLFRWYTYWKIQTPPGYSSLIMHPIHRHDLPFFTLTGIVDTDQMPNFLLLPFFIKEGFSGFIDVDTPIAQVIPFKRDEWKSEIKKFDKNMAYSTDRVKIDFERTYKKRFWSKKIFR